MSEEMPSTGLTLAGAKQYLSNNFANYTIKKTSERLYFGLDVWHVEALEKVPNINSLRKRQFRLYTKGIDDEAKAWWEATQGPMQPPTTIPEPTFVSRLETYIKTKIDDDTIKFGFIVQPSESLKRAICNVIMPDKSDKTLLISEDSDGKFSFEVLV